MLSTIDPQTAKTDKKQFFLGNNGAGSGIRTPSPLATSPATFPLFLGLNFNPNPTSE
jgi:hypothetical protein